MTVVGVDISSRAVDLAWMQDGVPQRWTKDLGKGHLIDRVRQARVPWIDALRPLEPTEIVVEYPFGRSRAGVAALMAVAGVVTASTPPWCRVSWPSAGELRAAIGAKNSKADAHRAVSVIVFDNPFMGRNMILDGWSEHSLDALVACLGWTAILSQQDAA